MNTGKSLKIALIKAGKSQDWLAKEMSVSKQQICNWCATKTMRGVTMIKICSFLELDCSVFIAFGETKRRIEWMDR